MDSKHHKEKITFLRPVIALFFTAWGMFLRYQAYANRDLWGDETFTLKNTVGPFKPIWQRLSNGELTCFPGAYLTNYPFVALFGADNKWGISTPHIISALLGFYLLYLICNKYLKTHLAFTVSFIIMCFHGGLIYHAFEFRPYAVLPTLSLAAFYFAGIIIDEGKNLSLLKKYLIGCFFIFTVIYHAYGILIVGLSLLFFLICASKERSLKEITRDFLPFGIPVFLISIILFLWYASGTIATPEHCLQRGINTFDVVTNPLDSFNQFIRTVFANLMGNKRYKQKLLVYGIWIAFVLPYNKERFRQIGFLLLLIILPVQLILFSDLRGGYWFLDRQFIWVSSLYTFFIGWCWDSIFLAVLKGLKKIKIRGKKA